MHCLLPPSSSTATTTPVNHLPLTTYPRTSYQLTPSLPTPLPPQERGSEAVEILRAVRDVRAAAHLTQWEVERCELRGRHAAAELTDLQLLTVTKDVQVGVRVGWRGGRWGVCGCS